MFTFQECCFQISRMAKRSYTEKLTISAHKIYLKRFRYLQTSLHKIKLSGSNYPKVVGLNWKRKICPRMLAIAYWEDKVAYKMIYILLYIKCATKEV